MGDLIYYCIIGALFVINLRSIYIDRKRNNFVYKVVFISNPWDWALAALTIAFVIGCCIVLEPIMPSALNWSWPSYFFSKESSNINIEIIYQSMKLSSGLLILLFVFFILLLPKAAYEEEKIFRLHNNKLLHCIIPNLKFGFAHCIVGVPLWVGGMLCLVGFLLSLRYLYALNKHIEPILSDTILEYGPLHARNVNRQSISLEYNGRKAILESTSLHGKYNIVLVTILFISLICIF